MGEEQKRIPRVLFAHQNTFGESTLARMEMDCVFEGRAHCGEHNPDSFLEAVAEFEPDIIFVSPTCVGSLSRMLEARKLVRAGVKLILITAFADLAEKDPKDLGVEKIVHVRDGLDMRIFSDIVLEYFPDAHLV